MTEKIKFEVVSVRDPKIVDGSIEITVQVHAHGFPSPDGELRLKFGKEASANLAARLMTLSRLPQLK